MCQLMVIGRQSDRLLVLVSLTGQFLPGMAILQGAGYPVKAKPIIGVTSLVSLPVAFLGVLPQWWQR